MCGGGKLIGKFEDFRRKLIIFSRETFEEKMRQKLVSKKTENCEKCENASNKSDSVVELLRDDDKFSRKAVFGRVIYCQIFQKSDADLNEHCMNLIFKFFARNSRKICFLFDF